MPAYITLNKLTVLKPDQSPLFTDLTLSIGQERIGLVGRNGAGKSTLFAALRGAYPVASGHISSHGHMEELAQSPDPTGEVCDLLDIREELARLDRLEAGEGTADDLSEADWTLPDRVADSLRTVGLSHVIMHQAVSTLSGGERTRAGLARLLIKQPDILLLDEPTNNLDADGRVAIRNLVRDWKGAVIIASHDRALLDHVDRIVHLSPVGVTIFGGGWSAFVEAREAERARTEKAVDDAERALAQTRLATRKQEERQARRDRMGRKKRAEKSAPKLLLDARKERAEATAGRDAGIAARQQLQASEALKSARQQVEILTPIAIDLPEVFMPQGRVLLDVSAVGFRIGERQLFRPLSFTLRGGDRIAVSGANGAGKSTLLRAIMGQGEPTSGKITQLTLKIGFLDQHVSLLDRQATLLENMQRISPQLTENAARAVLARFGFRNVQGEQMIADMSGGERLRAGLACVLGGPAPAEILMLDEPTNHLDIETIEVLEVALSQYSGGLIVVSHDATFLKNIQCNQNVRLKSA